MCKVIEKTPMGEVFKLHWSTDSLTTEAEQLPQNYLHDFIRLVYKTENKGEDGNEEHKVISKTNNRSILILLERACNAHNL